jgi:virginiamycin B lyase
MPMTSRRLATAATGALAACLVAAAPQPTAEAPVVTEWPVPWEGTRPRDPDVAPDGTVWFVGQRGDYLAAFDPASGTFRRHDLPAGTGPHNLVVGGDGTVWYAGNRAAHIGRFDPRGGTVEKIAMPDAKADDPHTLVFGAGGDLWFTVQGGNFVGHLATKSEQVRLLPVPTAAARPYGIVTDPAGRPWFTEFGSHKLGTVDPETMELTEVALPREAARPRRLARTSDGAIWYVDYAEGILGRYDPAASSFREWPVPGGEGARPYAMAADDRDRIWFVESGPEPNRLVGFDPAAERFFGITPLESGGGSVRHMVFHRPSRSLWFGTDANTLARAVLP